VCMALLLAATAIRGLTLPSGVVRVTDAASRRPVLLVGTMHYNPHSVAVVRGTIRAAAEQTGLHATAIELCASRWNSTAAARWREKRLGIAPYERLLSEDEFQVAWEDSVACGLPDVVLADQSIALSGRRLGDALLRTARDLLTPSGWRRVARDLNVACLQTPTFARQALRGKLLAGAPLAMARYIYQSHSALPFAFLSIAALGLAAAVDEATGAVATWDDGVVTALAAVVIGRSVFVSLIEERDRVLARNIRDACLAPRAASDADEATSETSAVVVAVLGMAHLAGVRKALSESNLSSIDEAADV
jgi:hypothetical protein